MLAVAGFAQILKLLPPGRSLWMLCGLDLLFPMLMSHGKSKSSGNFSCKKLPLVFRPVLPIVLKTKLRKPWKRNRTRESSKPVVNSKISSENVAPRSRNIDKTQNTRCMAERTLMSFALYINGTALLSHTSDPIKICKSVTIKSALHNNLELQCNCISERGI